MNRKLIIFISAVFACVWVNSLNSTSMLAASYVNDAYFAEVDYPKYRMYQSSADRWLFWVDLNVSNTNCSEDLSDEAWFFFKVYGNDELWWNEYNDTDYHVWRCNIGSTIGRRYQVYVPTWRGPNGYRFNLELYWYHNNTPYLQDTTSFAVDCVLFVPLSHEKVFSYLSVYLLANFGLAFYLLAKGPIKVSERVTNRNLFC